MNQRLKLLFLSLYMQGECLETTYTESQSVKEFDKNIPNKKSFILGAACLIVITLGLLYPLINKKE